MFWPACGLDLQTGVDPKAIIPRGMWAGLLRLFPLFSQLNKCMTYKTSTNSEK